MDKISTSNTESRVKKTLLNARVNLIFYLLTLLVSFFSRRIFLECLGDNFVGLTSTLQNILGFLNLAELGIGTAIAYVLYKPIYDHDQNSINEIISVMGYLYRWIGLTILTCGIILSCFLPLIFPIKDTGFSLSLVYFAYYSFLASSLIGYFINYRQNLLSADQRYYVIAGYYQSINILKAFIQIGCAYLTRNVYLWVIIELGFGIIYSFILNWKINQTYPWLKTEIALGRKLLKKYPYIIKSIKQLFIHKIAAFVEYQSMPLLIYSIVSLPTVVLYTNYTLLIDKLNAVVNSIFTGFEASIGNLIAEGDKEKTIKVFWEINAMRYYIATILVFILLCAINPFITWWLGKQYLMENILVYTLLAYTYFRISNGYNVSFVYGYGLFNDIWAPIAEVIIMIGVAVIFGIKYGLLGVMMGPFASFILIVCIWKPVFLYMKGFKEKSLSYWLNIVTYLSLSGVSIGITIFIKDYIVGYFNLDNILQLIAYTLICTLSLITIYTPIMWVFGKGFKNLCLRFIKR